MIKHQAQELLEFAIGTSDLTEKQVIRLVRKARRLNQTVSYVKAMSELQAMHRKGVKE